MFLQKLKPVESNAPDTPSPQKASREPEPGPSHSSHGSETGAPEAAHVPPGVAAMNAALERQKKESTRKRPLQVAHSIPDLGQALFLCTSRPSIVFRDAGKQRIFLEF